ncbi:MAG: hypothetical protein ACLSHX_17880 [Suilimivivens sp.]
MAMAIADSTKKMVQRLPYGMLIVCRYRRTEKSKGTCIRLSVHGCRTVGRSSMEPFMCDLDSQINGKTIALFGSMAGAMVKWMKDWEDRIASDGATVLNAKV